MKKLLIAFALALAIISPAQAASTEYAHAGGWDIKVNNIGWCLMRKQLGPTDYMMFGAKSDILTLTYVSQQDKWGERPGAAIDAELQFDNEPKMRSVMSVRLLSDTWVLEVRLMNEEHLLAFLSSYEMRVVDINTRKEFLDISLDGTYAAFQAYLECTQAMSGDEEGY